MRSTRAHPSLVWKSVLMVLAILGISASGLLARPARAQGDGAYFPVFVLACDAYVKMKGSASGMGYPPECRGLGDVTVTAYDTKGLGSMPARPTLTAPAGLLSITTARGSSSRTRRTSPRDTGPN